MAKSYVYRPDDLKYSNNWAREIGKTAQFLEVDPEAIAGFLQKEINDRTNRAEKDIWGAVGVGFQKGLEQSLLSRTHLLNIPAHVRYMNPWANRDVENRYDADHEKEMHESKFRQLHKYAYNTAMSEWGPGSIKLGTAMRQINHYAKRFEAEPDATDPLDLKKYIGNPKLLAEHMADWSNPATIRITGLLAREFKDMVRDDADKTYWNSLTPEQKNATFVSYAVLGQHNSKENIDNAQMLARDKRKDYRFVWRPAPGPDEESGGPGFVRNQPAIRAALETGGAYEMLWPNIR